MEKLNLKGLEKSEAGIIATEIVNKYPDDKIKNMAIDFAINNKLTELYNLAEALKISKLDLSNKINKMKSGNVKREEIVSAPVKKETLSTVEEPETKDKEEPFIEETLSSKRKNKKVETE